MLAGIYYPSDCYSIIRTPNHIARLREVGGLADKVIFFFFDYLPLITLSLA